MAAPWVWEQHLQQMMILLLLLMTLKFVLLVQVLAAWVVPSEPLLLYAAVSAMTGGCAGAAPGAFSQGQAATGQRVELQGTYWLEVGVC